MAGIVLVFYSGESETTSSEIEEPTSQLSELLELSDSLSILSSPAYMGYSNEIRLSLSITACLSSTLVLLVDRRPFYLFKLDFNSVSIETIFVGFFGRFVILSGS